MMSYLVHHGIKGQKWGVRHGPPYPLKDNKSSDRSSKRGAFLDALLEEPIITTYVATGAIVSGVLLGRHAKDRISNSDLYKKDVQYLNLNKNVKKQLIDIDVVDYQKVYKTPFYTPDAEEGRKRVEGGLSKMKATPVIHSIDELPKWENGKNTVDNSMSIVNRELSSLVKGRKISEISFPEYMTIMSRVGKDRMVNCQFCSIAYEMNRRGIKCKANSREEGGYLAEYADVFKINKKDSVMHFRNGTRFKGNPESVIKRFENYGDGARGNISIYWKGGGGHLMAWENVNGHFTVIDAQAGIKYSSKKDLKWLFNNTQGDFTSIRLDNLELKTDSKKLLESLVMPDN